jgi:hypothetical protein
MSDPRFEFEGLEVYQLALRLRPLVARIAAELPRGEGDLRGETALGMSGIGGVAAPYAYSVV